VSLWFSRWVRNQFCKDAVRIALTSGLTRKQVASDLVTLAHIKEQSRLRLGSYGQPRMTEKLKQIGLNAGHRRVGRLMRQNGISAVRTRKHKVTTDSNHKFNVAPNLLDRDFTADGPNQKWALHSTHRPRAAFTIPAGEANTVLTIIRSDCASTASVSQ